MNVRPARPDERLELARLQTVSWQNVYRGTLPDAYLDERLPAEQAQRWQALEIRPEDVVLVAEDDGLVGFVSVWCRPTPFVDNLHVLPAVRARGIGKALMTTAAEALVRQGQETAYLFVLEQNRRAVRFYQSLGGAIVERTLKPLCGTELMTLKVVWSDLAALAALKPRANIERITSVQVPPRS